MLQTWRKPYERQGLSTRTVDVIVASWRMATKAQYQVYINKWKRFCKERNWSFLQASLQVVLEFLSYLFNDEQASYSSLNTARSALVSFLVLEEGTLSLGSHPFVSRFMKGVFKLRTPTPRYTFIRDVKPVLDFLRRLSPARVLSLKQLTLKLATLIALLSAQRVQTIQCMSLDNMTLG